MALKYINTLDDETLDQSIDDWRGGSHESGRPTRLLPNQCQRLVNCLLDDEDATPKLRPGADALGGAAIAASRIDRLLYFDTTTTEYLLAALANSTLYKWDTAAWAAVAGYPFAQKIQDMAQLNNLVYASDATGNWRSLAPATDTWTDLGSGAANAPVGASILCVHTQRIFAAGNIGGVDDVIYASALGDAGVGAWSAANFSFRVGRGEGEPIKALCTYQGWWLAVGKEHSIYLVNADPQQASAAPWEIKRVAGSVGVVGKRAMATDGNSLFVVAPDRSLREIVPTDGTETPFTVLPPMSEAARPWFNRVNWAQASKIQLHKYGRWLLMSFPLDSASDNDTVLVWDLRFRVPSASGVGSFPAFLGRWTGWTPTAFCTTRFGAEGEMLVIGDTAGKANQWKEDEDEDDAATYLDNTVAIPSAIRTPSWDFQTPRNWKDGESVELEFVSSETTATITAYLDGVSRRTWEVLLEVDAPVLPLVLPFVLGDDGPTVATKSADGLVEFKEMFLEITTTGGRIELRRAAASAFLNTTRTE